MPPYDSEEEQLQALKRWWQENGSALLIGIGAALAIVFGWQAYQNSTQASREAASEIFNRMLQTSGVSLWGEAPATDTATSEALADQLITDYSNTQYAVLAGLMRAKQQVESGELDAAAERLRWVLDQAKNSSFEPVARLRLARVLGELDQADEALALLTLPAGGAGAYQASFEEVRGDLYMKKGELEAAKTAYLNAREAARASGQPRPLLDLKLSELAVDRDV